MNRRPDSPETGHFLRARPRAPAMGVNNLMRSPAAAIASAACSRFRRPLAGPFGGSSATARATHPRYGALVALGGHTHPASMFVVTEAEAAAIRAVYEQRGEFSAAVELRRLFPAVTDTAQARACARTIAGWKPLPAPPRLATQAERRGSR